MQVLPVSANRERIPLTDKIDHVAFGVSRLKQEQAGLSKAERRMFLERLPVRIESLVNAFDGFGVPVRRVFEVVGADYGRVCNLLEKRQKELIAELPDGGVSASRPRSPAPEMAVSPN